MLFWVQFGLGLPQWGWTLILVQAMSSMAFIPIWIFIQRRLGTWAGFLLSLAGAVIMSLAILLVPARCVSALITFGIINGGFSGAAFMLLRVLLGHVLDDPHSGRARQASATIYSGFHLAYNLAASLGLFLALHLLACLGFDPHHGGALSAAIMSALDWVIVAGSGLPVLTALALAAHHKDLIVA